MTTNITILYNNSRKVFKSVSPSTILQSLVTESLEYFNLPAVSQCQLKHRKSILDLSQPIRFCNLPNNAQLELALTTSSSSGKSNCKIALSVIGDSTSSCSSSFPDSASLRDILQTFVEQGRLPSNLFQLSPELIYLRASFTTPETLAQATLSSLGLSGQSVRFQLRYKLDATPSDQKAEKASVQNPEIKAIESVPSSPFPSTAHSPREEIKTFPKATALLSQPLSPLTAAPESTFTSGISLLPPPTTATAVIESTSEFDNTAERPAEDSFSDSSAVSPREAVRLILSQNFDATSKPAVILVLKYLINVRLHPLEDKFHVIKFDNKIVREKLLTVKGAVLFLLSTGFKADSALHGVRYFPGNEHLIDEGIEVLQGAMDELEIPLEDRPIIPDKQIVSNLSHIAFDPFKSHVIRQGLQLPKGQTEGQSVTDLQLEQLKKRRNELEGNPADVTRKTQVLLPTPISNLLPPSASKQSSISDLDSNEPASSSLPKSIIQKFLKRDEEEEGKPLTTQAIRELEKLRNEKVYKETIVRIRFPDKVQLIGVFHPRHSLKDVYLWILDQLRLTEDDRVRHLSLGTEEERIVFAMNMFEIFISPPKTILLPAKLSKKSNKFVEWNESDLLSHGLVPAAILSLTWKKDQLLEVATASTAQLGSYLKEELLSSAFDEVDDSIAQRRVLPQSLPLVEKAPAHQTAEEKGTLLGKRESKPSPSGGLPNSSASSNKPKWFKL